MRLTVAAALLALTACSQSTEGPTPQVAGVVNPRIRNVTPAHVCNAQGGERGWRLEVAGARFSPTAADVLTDSPGVAVPEVTLRGPVTLTLPRERVFYVRPEVLLLDLPTRDSASPVDLPAGSYAVEVENPLGGTGSLADALVVVPPPTVTRVVPPAKYLFGDASPFVIEGVDFQPGTFPFMVLRRAGEEDRPLFVYTVVSPTRIETELPPGTPEGTYELVLTNPEGCASSLPRALNVTYERLGTLTVSPRSGSELSNQRITVSNVPTGAQRGFSGAPQLSLVAPLKTDPTVPTLIPLREVTFVSATEVRAVVPTCSGFDEPPVTDPRCPGGILPGGPYAIRVTDPGGAVGEVPASAGFSVTAGGPGVAP